MAGVIDDIGGDTSAEGVDARVSAGGLLPEGFYPARLNGAKDVESRSKGTPGYELTFAITSGPFEGTDVTDTLWRSDKQLSKDRIKLFAHRLGLLGKSGDGKSYTPVGGKSEFVDVLDTPVIIQVVHEPDQNDPNKKWLRLAFEGVFLPNDPGALAAVKNGGKRPEPPAAGKAAPNKGPTPSSPTATAKAAPAAGAKAAPATKKMAHSEL